MTQPFSREIDGYQLTRSARSKNPPSRYPALNHGSDFASTWLVLDSGVKGYVGQVGMPEGLAPRVIG